MNLIVKLKGGLGNQMFQYAFYLALKKNNPNANIKLDITQQDIKCVEEVKLDILYGKNVKKWKQRNIYFELDKVFGIDIDNIIATKSELYKIKYRTSLFYGILGKILAKFIGKSKNYIRYPHAVFIPEMLNPTKNTIYNGFWQSEKYFFEIKNEIRAIYNNFQVDKNDVKINEVLSLIKNNCSVSLHIRRGDYINSETGDDSLCCDINYYKQGIEIIKNNVENPIFFVFSDDIQWCKNNFDGNFYYIDFNKNKNSYVDMFLMSNCKHNIIANSSFSWWGAWLNNNPNKIVIYPDKWSLNLFTDIAPNSWIKI